MKGIILLISEPPNNRHIVFKYTHTSLPPNTAHSDSDKQL